jgi:thiol-disulfide isomerase/thioredoxin
MTSTAVEFKRTTEADSVVTPERFSSGMSSYQEWNDSIEKNKEQFNQHYEAYTPKDEHVAAIKQLIDDHGLKALLIGTDWCPDVWRGLPVVARLQEATGLEVRYFERDENKDIMAEFLKDGEFESIPTIVLYDRDHKYLGHWIERADLANEEMKPLRALFSGTAPDSDERKEAMAKYRAKTAELAGPWRDAQVDELIALVNEALD